jgi:hypothetical protein
MESEVTPVLRNNPCSRLFKRVFMVKTAGQFPCGSQIPQSQPVALCSAKIESTSPIAQLENVIATWMSPAYIAYVVLHLYSNYEVAKGNDRNSVVLIRQESMP